MNEMSEWMNEGMRVWVDDWMTDWFDVVNKLKLSYTSWGLS